MNGLPVAPNPPAQTRTPAPMSTSRGGSAKDGVWQRSGIEAWLVDAAMGDGTEEDAAPPRA